MDQNGQNPQSDTPPPSDTPNQSPQPVTPPAPASPQTPPPSAPAETSSQPVENPAPPIPSTPSDQPVTAAIPEPVDQPATPPAAPPAEQKPDDDGLPKTSNKKTIAVAAAGISVILVILGVYAMTKDEFTTQTQQQAAVPSPTPEVIIEEPTVSPTPSDTVEQSLEQVQTDVNNADAASSQATQGLSITPPNLE